MSIFWGHWPEDGFRHIIQVSRAEANLARRFCRPDRIEDAARIPHGGGESDLPACGNCATRRGFKQAGAPPNPRPGWIASPPSPQRRLEVD